ncbi:unnamed protein product [Euphydryas editha]|uniref:Uncharacterized protein n=1 Tax=Euphydryas editha TaxID=104508 RepID=A0AAU9U162_EUPED|nr:unnamed protein product [Euphydryas editha]
MNIVILHPDLILKAEPHGAAPHRTALLHTALAATQAARCRNVLTAPLRQSNRVGLALLALFPMLYKQLSGAAAAPHCLHPSPPRLPRAIVRCACGAAPEWSRTLRVAYHRIIYVGRRCGTAQAPYRSHTAPCGLALRALIYTIYLYSITTLSCF